MAKIAPADRLDADARRRLGELSEIAVDLGRRRELARGPDDMPEILRRRDDRRRIRDVGDPGIAEAVRKDNRGIGYNNINFAYGWLVRL